MSCPLPVHVDWWRLLNDDADPGAVDKKNLQPFLTKAIFKKKGCLSRNPRLVPKFVLGYDYL